MNYQEFLNVLNDLKIDVFDKPVSLTPLALDGYHSTKVHLTISIHGVKDWTTGVVDSLHGQQVISLQYLDSKALLNSIRRLINQMVTHEVDEQIVFKDQRSFNPHDSRMIQDERINRLLGNPIESTNTMKLMQSLSVDEYLFKETIGESLGQAIKNSNGNW